MQASSRWAIFIALLATSSPAWAEFRTWSAAVGNFQVEAEMIELRDGVVHLRMKDGTERAVPLGKLSATDRQFAQEHATQPSGDNARLAKLRREAANCPSAEERLRLYRVFCQESETTEADRRAVAGEMEKLRELAEKHMLWMRGSWVTEEQFEQVRNQANSLMRQGIELLRLKQEDGFQRKFSDAAALEPDTIRADFLAGMLYALAAADFSKSKQCFEKCAKREPDNVAVLNNLALVELKRGAVPQAVTIWQRAIAIKPNQQLVQNLGRFLEQAGKKKFTASKHSTEVASELYTGLLASEKFQPATAQRGWVYMLLDQDLLSLAKSESDKKEERRPAHLPPPGEDGSVVIGGGTGFVVFPHYILTNNHVVASATSYEVQSGDGGPSKRFPARLIAHSEKPDLALLYCESIEAPPLALDPTLCRRGTDIMTLGYPEMFLLGASLKATRGVISAVPSSVVDDMYLYDAVVNHGNSGGPVCNRSGNVVAVTTIMVSTEGKYGGGIPAATALEFVRKHVPGYQTPDLQTATLEWPSVDERASPSTLLIWSRSKTPAASRPEIDSGYFEDHSCDACHGQRTVACKCASASSGRRRPSSASTPCAICNGKKTIPCPECGATGISPDFQIVRIVPDQSAPRSSPPERDRPPEGGSKVSDSEAAAKLAASVESAIRDNRLENTSQLGSKATGAPFTFLPPEHGFLIGLDLRYRDGHLVSVRSLYQNGREIVKGQWHGSPASKEDESRRVYAKPGYAVGGLRISEGESLDDLALIFMRIDGDRLNPGSRYLMRAKSAGDHDRSDIGMTGAPAVGIVGQTGPGKSGPLISLGLIVVGSANRASDQAPVLLDPALPGRIQDALRNHQLQNSELLGKRAGGDDFHDIPSNRGILVGFDLWYDDGGRLLALRPIYHTVKGVEHTRPYGTKAAMGGRSSRILARQGYAVGGLRIAKGESLDDLSIVFMRVTGDHLNPGDRYEVHGKPNAPDGPTIDVGMTGSLMVGIIGKRSPPPDSLIMSVGLISFESGSGELSSSQSRR